MQHALRSRRLQLSVVVVAFLSASFGGVASAAPPSVEQYIETIPTATGSATTDAVRSGSAAGGSLSTPGRSGKGKASSVAGGGAKQPSDRTTTLPASQTSRSAVKAAVGAGGGSGVSAVALIAIALSGAVALFGGVAAVRRARRSRG